MNWERFGRKRSWHLVGGNEENQEKQNSARFGVLLAEVRILDFLNTKRVGTTRPGFDAPFS